MLIAKNSLQRTGCRWGLAVGILLLGTGCAVIQLSVPNAEDSRVNQILVDEGEYVEAGQVIAILQGYERRQRDLEKAQKTVDFYQARLEQLLAGEAKTAEIAAQQAAIAALEAQQRNDLADTQVRVPIAGQILRLNTRVGERVNTEEGIAELGQTREMYAIASLSRWAPDTPIGTELAYIKLATMQIQQTTQALGTTLKTLSTGASRLPVDSQKPKPMMLRWSFRVGIAGLLAVSILGCSLWQLQAMAFIKQRVIWSQIKLQRIERQMGIDSDSP